MRNHLFKTNVLPDQDLWYFIMVYAFESDRVPNMQEKVTKRRKSCLLWLLFRRKNPFLFLALKMAICIRPCLVLRQNMDPLFTDMFSTLLLMTSYAPSFTYVSWNNFSLKYHKEFLISNSSSVSDSEKNVCENMQRFFAKAVQNDLQWSTLKSKSYP